MCSKQAPLDGRERQRVTSKRSLVKAAPAGGLNASSGQCNDPKNNNDDDNEEAQQRGFGGGEGSNSRRPAAARCLQEAEPLMVAAGSAAPNAC